MDTLLSIFGPEVVGTALLTLLGCGVVANVAARPHQGAGGGWLVITFGWGMAVLAGVVRGRAVQRRAPQPGGHARARERPATPAWSDVPEYLAAEFIGAFLGAVFAWLAYRQHFDDTEDPGLKLAVLLHRPGDPQPGRQHDHRDHRHLRAGLRDPHVLRQRAPPRPASARSLVALLVVGIGASLGGPTGYAINPARDLGPRIAHALLPIAGKGVATGATRGSRWSVRSSAASLGALAFDAFFPG